MGLFKSFEKAAREDPNAIKGGYTLVQNAAAKGNVDRLKLLAEHGADMSAMGTTRRSAMYMAVGHGGEKTMQCLKVLLENGGDPNLPDSDGEPPLHRAYREGHREAFELLLDHGADPSIGRDNYSSLRRCVAEQDPLFFEPIAEKWLKKNPDRVQGVMMHVETAGITPDSRARFIALIEKHVDKSVFPATPKPVALSGLAQRVADGDRVAVKVHLDENGYDAATDAEGRTPLHIAAQSGDHRMILMLLDAGADANAKDDVGFTPLDTLAEHGHLDSHAERFLTEAGGAFNRLPPKDDVTAKKKAHVKISQPGTGT